VPLIPDASVQLTNERCAADPRYAQTHEALARIERELHRQGWDAPPRLWRLTTDPEHQCVNYDRSAFTGILDKFGAQDYPPPKALHGLALMAEAVAGVPNEMGLRLPQEERELGKAVTRGAGEHMYGYVFSCNAFQVAGSVLDDEDKMQRIERAAAERRVRELPGLVAVRHLTAVCRDGSIWTVIREKGKQPRTAVRLPQDADAVYMSGLLINSLARLVKAMAPDADLVPPPVSADIESLRERAWRAAGPDAAGASGPGDELTS
jgi:hypothetical protein